MFRRLATLVTVSLIVGHTARAQDAVELSFAPSFEKGSTQLVEIETTSDQTLTIAGTPIETHVNTFLTMKEKAVEQTSEGGWNLSGEFSLIQSDMEFPGGLKASFNSNNPGQANAAGELTIVTDALKAMAKAKWFAETNDKHEVVKLEYVGGDPFENVNPMLKGQGDPESIMKARAMELQRYPEKPVKPGDTWTLVEESNLGGGQTLTLEKQLTYAGPEERNGRTFDKVTVKSLSVEYSMDDDSPSQAKITDSELEVASSEGAYYYDREVQAFTEASETVQITGTLTMEINDQELPGELDLTISAKTKSKLIAP